MNAEQEGEARRERLKARSRAETAAVSDVGEIPAVLTPEQEADGNAKSREWLKTRIAECRAVLDKEAADNEEEFQRHIAAFEGRVSDIQAKRQKLYDAENPSLPCEACKGTGKIIFVRYP